MFTASDLTCCRNTVIIDPSLGVEIARQSHLYRLLKQHLSGTLPRGYTLAGTRRILDLACGPGDWATDAAFADPDLDVFGIDACPAVIEHARMQSRAQGLENTSFQVMDLLAPLDFCDQDFDFINGRFLNACLPPEGWPPLLKECRRILRPGGIIRLTECSYGVCTSRACEQLSEVYAYLLQRRGLRCTPAGTHLQIPGPMPVDACASIHLDELLVDAGYRAIERQAQTLEFGVNDPAYHEMLEQTRVFLCLIKPFLLSEGAISEETYERLYQQAQIEMRDDCFFGRWLFSITWAKAPGMGAPASSSLDGTKTL